MVGSYEQEFHILSAKVFFQSGLLDPIGKTTQQKQLASFESVLVGWMTDYTGWLDTLHSSVYY
jgi:hypothetical protein